MITFVSVFKLLYARFKLIMQVSLFELLKIGIGPSSSHTVGPMRSSLAFIKQLQNQGLFTPAIMRVQTDLYGSLALTGKGHATDHAIMLGLMGEKPDTVDIQSSPGWISKILDTKTLKLNNQIPINFVYKLDLLFHKKKILPYHTNGMTFTAFTEDGPVLSANYYSIGGGFISTEEEMRDGIKQVDKKQVPYPFTTAKELLAQCLKHNLTIPQIALENEKVERTEEEIFGGIDKIWKVMEECIERGLNTSGRLPGPLNVHRRAFDLHNQLLEHQASKKLSLIDYLDYVCAYALAVSEENAIGGRVVTAPTNGAAGVLPGVLKFAKEFYENDKNPNMHRDFLLTASAIGTLFKIGASISGAEGGCMAEIGTACAMAAAGFAQILGGSTQQIFNAANIAAEHNLGLTCDPILGLVQIPCIERNSMAAVKAINAATLAMRTDSDSVITLDRTIRVVKKTGDDMKKSYKETALGGLAWDFVTFDEDGKPRTKSDKIKFSSGESAC